jgi:hypothetical protein
MSTQKDLAADPASWKRMAYGGSERMAGEPCVPGFASSFTPDRDVSCGQCTEFEIFPSDLWTAPGDRKLPHSIPPRLSIATSLLHTRKEEKTARAVPWLLNLPCNVAV